jgi:hypothetical protein
MKIKQEILKEIAVPGLIVLHSPVNVTSLTLIHSNSLSYGTSRQIMSLYADFTKR